MMDLKVRYADTKDLVFIDYLQKKNAEDLSFYPKVVLEREVANERILLALVNNEHAGYLYHGSNTICAATGTALGFAMSLKK